MALIPNGGSRKFQSVMPPKRRFETGQYGAKFGVERKTPPKIILKKPTPGIESYGKIGGGRSKTGFYIPESGDVPALKHVGRAFLEDLTPEARTQFMNVPTQVGKPAQWYAGIPFHILSGLLGDKSLEEFSLFPPATFGRMIGGREGIDIDPRFMEPGMEYPREVLMEHELLHSWDQEQLERLEERGGSLTGLPGILDEPYQLRVGGPGAAALEQADMSDELLRSMKEQYVGSLAPAERYTMLAQLGNFDPSAIPSEYQHLYAGLFNQESFVRPPPPEPLKIDELLEQQMGGRDSRQIQPPNELIDMEHPYVQNLRDWGFSDKLIWTGLNEITRGRALTSQTLGRIVDEGGANGVAEDTAVEVFEAVTNSYLDALTPRLREEYLEHY